MIRKTGVQAPQKLASPHRPASLLRASVPEPHAGWRAKSAARVAPQGVSLKPQRQPSADDLIAQVNANKASAPQSTAAVAGVGLKQSTTAVSAEQLHRMMPNVSPERAAAMAPYLNRAMQEAGINTPRRAAAFIAQLGHESGQLRYFEELASGRAYEGRRDLGNTQPGDGMRFKGRGPIQLTGRANYEAASRALGGGFTGGPVATVDTPTPPFDQRPPRVYQTGRPGAGQPPGGAPAPDAGFTRMSNSYSTRASASASAEVFLLMLQLMLESLDPESLANDPEFQQFAQESGADWAPGQPVPQALAAEFTANKLGTRIQAGESPEKLLAELKQKSAAAQQASLATGQ